MTWVAALTETQRKEIITLKAFRERAILEVGKAYVELTRIREVQRSAEQNLRVAETAVFEINDRIAARAKEFLAGHDVDVINIDELE